MVSDSDRIFFGVLGEYFKSVVNEDNEMTLFDATNGGLQGLLKKHFERETKHTRFLKTLSSTAQGEAQARITTALYDQCDYLEQLSSLPGVFDEFFAEKTSSSLGYRHILREEIESAKAVEEETRKYLESQS